MLDPSKLKVGDRVSFISIPDEWSNPKVRIPEESRQFMEIMIKRRSPSRVKEIDEYGEPWIEARIKVGGRYEYHS